MVLQEHDALKRWFGGAVVDYGPANGGHPNGWIRQLHPEEAFYYHLKAEPGATIYSRMPYDVSREVPGLWCICDLNFGGGGAANWRVEDAAGGLIVDLQPGHIAKIYLVDVSTAEGGWDYDIRTDGSRGAAILR